MEYQQQSNKWFYLTIFITIVFGATQIMSLVLNRQRLTEKKKRFEQKKSFQEELLIPVEPKSNEKPSKKPQDSKIQNMNEEIERVERVMKRRGNSRQTSQLVDDRNSIRQRSDNFDQNKGVISASKHPITRICLTGGPCAGKTTALATLTVTLQQMGFKVLIIPEGHSLLLKGGATMTQQRGTFSSACRYLINLMKLQMNLEDIFIQIAQTADAPCIIICDRGVMDGSAFTDETVWQAVLDETGWSSIQLRDRRYEAVIHLVTAAEGAEEFYTNSSNDAHLPSKQEARDIDKKLINAWVGHPHFSIIQNNYPSFQQKMDSCQETVLKFIGLPSPSAFIKKFLLIADKTSYDIHTPKNVKKEYFQLEETFLIFTHEDQIDNVVRKVGKNDSYIYSHENKFLYNNERIQKKRQITAREYIELLEQKEQNKKQVKKLRQCFIYEQQYFMVDTFLNVEGSPSIMRIETTKEAQSIQIPPFVKVLREVTEEVEYETRTMANHNYKMLEKDKKTIDDQMNATKKQQ